MIIMDLEWNRGYDRKKLDEILQIGAVRVDGPGTPVRDFFCAFIRPRIHRKFDPGAKKLPDLQQSIDAGVSFAEAWSDFVAWCGGDREFAFWGPDDFQVLRGSCAFWGVACIEPERVYDYQRAFAHACGVPGATAALWRAVDYLGIPAVYDFHNALYDALYTALVGERLRREDLEYVPPRRVREHSAGTGERAVRKRRGTGRLVSGPDAGAAQAASASGQEAAPVKKRRRRRRRHGKVDIKQSLQNGGKHDSIILRQTGEKERAYDGLLVEDA